ncbi:MAG: aldehyde ferredoxin oxidoreductase family protein [Chloroflexi bacterium]|nr:aldehyde ferredoxin oxidoreductase family protein [Chloroflexota bacterium]
MAYGWVGGSLEIDLSQGKVEKQQNDPGLYQAYLGGKGIGTRLFRDKAPLEVDPFSPENLLIFATGVLVGIPTPSASFGTVSFKSPQTNLLSYCAMGGFWAAELKHAGYDTVIVSGKSPSPVYIWIDDDHVEIRDASHLWGKSTPETQAAIRQELGNNSAQVICIGPAGENRLFMASIEHGGTNSAGRAGVGAVMGDKNLKAIAIHGTRDIDLARPAEFVELSEQAFKRSETLRDWVAIKNWCHNYMQEHMDWALYGNADDMPAGSGFERYGEICREFVDRSLARELSCYNCPVKCKSMVSLGNGKYYPVKCQAWMAFTLACKIPDLAFGVKCFDLCVKQGMDYISTARTLAFAIELYQKGILTREDTDGLRLEYGNAEVALTLIAKMARREGLGNILADGTNRAAGIIGRGAEEHVYVVKKLELMTDSVYNPYYAFVTATSDRADLHFGTVALSPSSWHRERDAYIEEGWWLFPQSWRQYLDVDYSANYAGLAEMTVYGEDTKTFVDLAGICWFCTGFWPFPFLKIGDMARLVSCATGMEVDEAEARKIASRTRTLIQASNVRLGMTRRDDTVPEKFFAEEPTQRQKELELVRLDRGQWDKQLDRYYELRGWNSQGVPTAETLDELGLDDVRQDLEERGIL